MSKACKLNKIIATSILIRKSCCKKMFADIFCNEEFNSNGGKPGNIQASAVYFHSLNDKKKKMVD